MGEINKLVVYVDGSYKDKKGGWGFLYYYSDEPQELNYGYGTCSTENSNQAEVLACIKALENIVPYKNIAYIEIRTDYMEVVDAMNKTNMDYYMHYNYLAKITGDTNMRTLLKLIEIIFRIDYHVRFVKASKKNNYIKKVHRLAKSAMISIPVNEEDYFLWSAVNVNIKDTKNAHILDTTFDPNLYPFSIWSSGFQCASLAPPT